jgi:signal transduction histidine kinase
MIDLQVLIISLTEELHYTISEIMHQSRFYTFDYDGIAEYENAVPFMNDKEYDLLIINIEEDKELSSQFIQFIRLNYKYLPIIILIPDDLYNVDLFENMSVLGVDDYILQNNISQEILDRAVSNALEKKETELFLHELNVNNQKLSKIVGVNYVDSLQTINRIVEQLSIVEDTEQTTIQNLKKIVAQLPYQPNDIINNIDIWSQFNTGKMKLSKEVVDINFLVKDVIAQFEEVAIKKKIKLSTSINKEILVKSDFKILQIVLSNLLSNAIKYSFDGGNVFIDCQINLDSTVISVKDFGKGINADLADAILQRDMYDSVIGTAGEWGIGMGLNICIDFVEILGGEFWLESEEGNGSGFYFSIP